MYSDTQSGNTKIQIGINWFRIGDSSEAAVVDLVGGIVLPSSSALASSRQDQVVGIETSKRFGTYALGLAMEYRITGAPDDETELAIGDIRTIRGTVGWLVSDDILFDVSAAHYLIDGDSKGLDEKQSYGTLTPQLTLTFSHAFRLKRSIP